MGLKASALVDAAGDGGHLGHVAADSGPGTVWHRLATVEIAGNDGNCWQRWKMLATLEIAGNAGKKSGDPLPAFPAIPARPAKQQFLAPGRPTDTWPPHRAAAAPAGNDSVRNDARHGHAAEAAGRKVVQQAGKSLACTFDGVAAWFTSW